QVGEYVPVVMPRTLAMLIAEIAVLKCGAAYVPIDPELPAERRTFMIRNCSARRIICDEHADPDLVDAELQWIDCVGSAGPIGHYSSGNLGTRAGRLTAAYVMYTSGSTSTPKDMIVPHHAVNHLAINNGYAQIDQADCLPHYSNPAFDASTFEIWGALLNG